MATETQVTSSETSSDRGSTPSIDTIDAVIVPTPTETPTETIETVTVEQTITGEKTENKKTDASLDTLADLMKDKKEEPKKEDDASSCGSDDDTELPPSMGMDDLKKLMGSLKNGSADLQNKTPEQLNALLQQLAGFNTLSKNKPDLRNLSEKQIAKLKHARKMEYLKGTRQSKKVKEKKKEEELKKLFTEKKTEETPTSTPNEDKSVASEEKTNRKTKLKNQKRRLKKKLKITTELPKSDTPSAIQPTPEVKSESLPMPPSIETMD